MFELLLGFLIAFIVVASLYRYISIRNKHYQEYVNRKVDDLHK